MKPPLVTVVCLCYNHEQFVEEAVESVVRQSYQNIQIILADDNSTDNSREVIKTLKQKYPSLELLLLTENVGNCAAFNKAFSLSKGDFIIDFATDDVMMPDRIEKQVELFSQLDDSYGVVFTDAWYIDESGKLLRDHFNYLKKKALINQVPTGDVYRELLYKYFVPSPTMMVRGSVMKKLGGYDEQLTYEDFDFWVRSSREYKYAFLNERLTKIRKSVSSMSTGWYKTGDRQLHSTYLVCQKALKLNRTEADHSALAIRLKYEIRQSIFSDNRDEANLFFDVLNKMGKVSGLDRIWMALGILPIPLAPLRRLYQKVKYG